MKINREARLNARQIFRFCLNGTTIDEAKFRTVVDEIATKKPRNFLPILSQLQRLLTLHASEHTHVVESAVDLPDRGASVFADLERKYGKPMISRYDVIPSLIGGLRIRVGSNVWDGSVHGRLQTLKQSLS
jgi:F-type H+-transporting ATPase subunit delta